ncbi:MAG: endolytic transglycosylase MltG [Actinomycetota bacterium]
MLDEFETTAERGRRRGLLIGVVSVLATLGLIAGASLIAFDSVKDFVSRFQVEDYDGSGGPEVLIVIEAGDDGAAVARKLVDADVIKSFDAIYRSMLTTDFTIYPGTYRFPSQISGARALEILIAGENRVTVSTTIPEGFRIREIIPQLATDLGLSEADLENEIQKVLARLPEETPNAEGYLFPATYTFDPGVTAEMVITAMVDRTEQALAKFDMTLKQSHEVMTLAALIQVEARLKEDFFKVSRVFQNRLELGMLLQSDATVSYGTGGTTVTTTDAQRSDENPYNTYLYPGLPAGPISNPGELAIEAALRPADGSWLYFVTVNLKTGETKFSNTWSEHEKAAQEFYAWLRENPEWND